MPKVNTTKTKAGAKANARRKPRSEPSRERAAPAQRRTRIVRAQSSTATAGRSPKRPGSMGRSWNRFYTGLRRDLYRYQPLVMFAALSAVVVAVYAAWASGLFEQAGGAARDTGGSLMGMAGLRVDQLSVEGRSQVSEGDVLSALQAEQGMMLFDFDTHAARARIEALPWVESAQVMRLLPDRLHVKIDERRPFAIWQTGGQFLLIDHEGVGLETLSERNIDQFSHLPQVVGEGANAHAAELLSALDEAPALKSRLKAANRIGDRRWNLRLDNGIDVRLPDTDLNAAIREIAVLDSEHRLLARDISVIDLRMPDVLVIKPGKGGGSMGDLSALGGRRITSGE